LTETAPAAPARPPRAGLLPRLGAASYEALLVAALVFVTGFLMLPLVSPGQAARGAPLTVPSLPSRVALFCALFAMLALYFVWSWTGGRRTLPMKTWHLRIAATRGGAPTRKSALLRYLAAWIGPVLALVGYAVLRDTGHAGLAAWLLVVNFAWAAADPDRQFLHDRIAGTRVVTDG
jgi:uncharacterized RDD family membrane protein YckC